MMMQMMYPQPIMDYTRVQEFPSNLPLPRTGKWTPEEEMYAYVVVECFRLGSLPDCENNCTLRKYLSKRLGCTGMRISKKYGPDLYGQDTYQHKELIDIKLYQMMRLRHLFLESAVRKFNKKKRKLTSAEEARLARKKREGDEDKALTDDKEDGLDDQDFDSISGAGGRSSARKSSASSPSRLDPDFRGQAE